VQDVRLALVLLFLAACSSSRAADRQLVRTAERFAEARSDQGEVALALWAWRLQNGDSAREQVTHAICSDEAGALLDALIDPPDLPAMPTIDDDAPLATLLVASAGETVLERAVRSARFTRALDRVPLSVALASLDRDHPWVADVRARAARAEPVLRGLARMVDALALRVEPRTGEHVRLAWLNVDAWADDLWGYEGRAAGGWVLARTPTHVTILDDRLRRRRVAATRVAPADVDEEIRRWTVGPAALGWGEDSLDRRGCGAVALRAWWALRRGRVWTALRVAEAARAGDHDDVSAHLSVIALDLARAVAEATFIDLALGRPRADAVRSLRRAAEVLGLAGAPAEPTARCQQRRAEVVDLADRLEAQDAALRAAPPLPMWSEWRRLSARERVPQLVRALADCDGDPTEDCYTSDHQVRGASQRVPPDAPAPVDARPEPPWIDGEAPWSIRRPSGCSSADQLLALGEMAIPALIEALDDRAPTRCVDARNGVVRGLLTRGECALRLLRAIVDSPGESLPFESSWHSARQARAREWWAEVSARGGLFTLKLTHVLEGFDRGWLSEDLARSIRWLIRHGGGREVELLRTCVVARRDDEVRAGLLGLLGQAPHDGYDALLCAELRSPSGPVAMAAASALLARGDRRGVARALDRATDRGAPDDEVLLALEVLSQAGAPELGAVVLRLVDRPACDDAARLALVDVPASPERLLALARLAARARELPPVHPLEDTPARLAVEMLEPIPAGGRPSVAPAARSRVVLAALADALRRRTDPDAHEHAAVTSCLLGADAMTALSAASGHDMRAPLLAALTLRDPVRRLAAASALDRLGLAGLRWLVHGAARVPLDVTEAFARASLLVVRVTAAPEVPAPVRVALEGWLDQNLDLDRVSDVLEAWEDADMEALELVIARPNGGGGVRVYATCPTPGPDAPGWLLRVVARGAGLERDASASRALPPSCRSTHALVAVQNALVDHPDEAARIVIRAER
jgi:hypothetical protein